MWYVGSLWTGDQTGLPFIGRWSFNHWTAGPVPLDTLYNQKPGKTSTVISEETFRLCFRLSWVFAAVCLFCSCDEQRLLSSSAFLPTVCFPLRSVFSLAAEHKLSGTRTSVPAARGLSGCDAQALEPGLAGCGAWVFWLQRRVRIFPQRSSLGLLRWQVDSQALHDRMSPGSC